MDVDDQMCMQWLMSQPADSRVMEIGLGHGLFTEAIAGRFQEWLAIDGDVAVVHELSARYGATRIHQHWLFMDERSMCTECTEGSWQRLSDQGTPVTTTTIDAINWSPTVIKMDCEGADFLVCVGAEHTIRQTRPQIWMETWGAWGAERYHHTATEFFEFWHDLDYVMHLPSGDAFDPYVWMGATTTPHYNVLCRPRESI